MPQHVSRASAARGPQRQRNRVAAPQGGTTAGAEQFSQILQKVCDDLGDGREPFLAIDDFSTLASQLEALSVDDYAEPDLIAKNWIAHKPNADKMMALYALALRRSLYSTPTDDEGQLDYAYLRTNLGVGLAGYAASCSHGLSLALACVRGDALRLYNALLAESASRIRAHTQQLRHEASTAHGNVCSRSSGSSSQSQPPPDTASNVPALCRTIQTAVALVHDSLTVMDAIWNLVSPRPDVHGPSGARIAASIPQHELLSIQLQQLGVLDRCSDVVVELMPHAAHHSGLPVRNSSCRPDMAFVLHVLDLSLNNAVQYPDKLRCMWLGTVAGRPPLPPPCGCPPNPSAAAGTMGNRSGNGERTVSGPSGVSGGCYSSASSNSGSDSGNAGNGHGGEGSGNNGGGGVRAFAPAAAPSPAIGLLLPSSLQCLLAAHVARLCAALDGGTDYGLTSWAPPTGQLPPGAQPEGGSWGPSPLALVHLQDAKGRFVDGERPPRTLGVGMALKALELWTRARGLWEGSATRDAWWVGDTVAAAERNQQQPGDSAASSSSSISGSGGGGGGGGGVSSQCRTASRGPSARVAAADLRQRLAAAEAEAAEAEACTPAAVAETVATGAASASTPSESPPAAVAGQEAAASSMSPATLQEAGAAVSSEHVTWLVRTLAALEVEASAEQLPPLSRTATAALCSRLAAAALARLHKEPVPHCRIADEGQARLLSAEALRCWRLALAPERTCQRRPAPPAAVRRLEAWWRAALAALAAGDRPTWEHLHRVATPLAAAGWPAEAGEVDVNSLVCGPCRGELFHIPVATGR